LGAAVGTEAAGNVGSTAVGAVRHPRSSPHRDIVVTLNYNR
jgi:hypothetical protein